MAQCRARALGTLRETPHSGQFTKMIQHLAFLSRQQHSSRDYGLCSEVVRPGTGSMAPFAITANTFQGCIHPLRRTICPAPRSNT